MKEKVYIRADAGTSKGLGHIIRCMALAHMLTPEFSVHFICREVPERVLQDIEKEGFIISKISSEEEFFSILEGDEIVVLDHYELSSKYQKEIKAKGCKLVCIDDLHDREFYADLIINHSPSVKSEDYNAQSYTRFALGLDHALLRPSFLEAAGKERVIRDVETAFICFGGSDPNNITKKCLEVLLKINMFTRITVVLGAANQNVESIKDLAERIPQVELHSSLKSDEMLDLLKKTELAIVPASGMLLETLAAGSIPFLGFSAENQKDLFDYFKSKEGFLSFNGLDFNEEEFRTKVVHVRETYKNWEEVKLRSQISMSSQKHFINFKNLRDGQA